MLVGINCDHCQACKTLTQNTRIVLYPLTALQGHHPPPSTEPLLPQHPSHLFGVEEGCNFHSSTAVSIPTSAAAQLPNLVVIPFGSPQAKALGSACTKIICARAATQECSGHWTHCSGAVAPLDSCCCHSIRNGGRYRSCCTLLPLWL